MTITLRFFASVRETVGVAHESIDWSPALDTVGAVREHLVARGGDLQRIFHKTARRFRQIPCEMHEIVDASTGKLNDLSDIAEGLGGLRAHAAFDDAMLAIDPRLPSERQRIAVATRFA